MCLACQKILKKFQLPPENCQNICEKIKHKTLCDKIMMYDQMFYTKKKLAQGWGEMAKAHLLRLSLFAYVYLINKVKRDV